MQQNVPVFNPIWISLKKGLVQFHFLHIFVLASGRDENSIQVCDIYPDMAITKRKILIILLMKYLSVYIFHITSNQFISNLSFTSKLSCSSQCHGTALVKKCHVSQQRQSQRSVTHGFFKLFSASATRWRLSSCGGAAAEAAIRNKQEQFAPQEGYLVLRLCAMVAPRRRRRRGIAL